MQWKRMLSAAPPLALVAAANRRARRLVKRLPRIAERRLHDLEGRIEGVRYRLLGLHPDEHAPDDIVADRIRSSLGTLENRLDMPRVHVTVEDHIALLHGDVPSDDAREALVEKVLAISGVEGVVSYLHVGLLPGDTRPSEGRAARHHSPALVTLVEAARSAGSTLPYHAVRAILATFCERIPDGERAHLLHHLPEDVRLLSAAPIRAGRTIHDVRDLVEAVESTGALIDTDRPRAVVEAVIHALHDLVPEEVSDVGAVLPRDLKGLWEPTPA